MSEPQKTKIWSAMVNDIWTTTLTAETKVQAEAIVGHAWNDASGSLPETVALTELEAETPLFRDQYVALAQVQGIATGLRMQAESIRRAESDATRPLPDELERIAMVLDTIVTDAGVRPPA